MLALPVLALLLAACGSDEPSVVTASAPTTPAPTVSTSADPAPSSTTASSPGGDRILDAVEALSAFGAAQQGTVTAEGCILFPAEAVWPASLAADFPFSRAKSTSVGFDAARHQVNLSCRFSSDPQDDYVYVSLGAAGECTRGDGQYGDGWDDQSAVESVVGGWVSRPDDSTSVWCHQVGLRIAIHGDVPLLEKVVEAFVPAIADTDFAAFSWVPAS